MEELLATHFGLSFPRFQSQEADIRESPQRRSQRLLAGSPLLKMDISHRSDAVTGMYGLANIHF
jgi:hypothetical protein